MHILFRITLLLIVCLSLGKGIYFLREGFNPRKIKTFSLAKISPIDEETQTILSQRFYFLGKGRQCFAFVSEDGKYVLKCPRTNIYQIPFWAKSLVSKKGQEEIRIDKMERQNFVFESFRIASEELKKETGVIATHLGESPSTKKKITLVDTLGVTHQIPLDTTIFILQHKRPLWTPKFLEATKNGTLKEQERILDALINIMVKRASHFVLSRDRSFLRNYGFDGTEAYQIDVGDFFQRQDWDHRKVFHKSIRDSLDPVQDWLSKVNPPMLAYLNGKIDSLEPIEDIPKQPQELGF